MRAMRQIVGTAILFALAFQTIAFAAPGDPELVSVRDATVPRPLTPLRDSLQPAISANGRFVAFSSASSQFVSGDTNDNVDIFVYDRQTGGTERVSVGAGGVQSNGLSATPSISADGRYVAFESNASNLSANDTDSSFDIFVRDRQAGTTTSITSGTADGDGGSAAISGNGRFVAFVSGGELLVHDRQTGATENIEFDADPANPSQHFEDPRLSGDGRQLVFMKRIVKFGGGPFPIEIVTHVYVHDRHTHVTRQLDVTPSGASTSAESFDVAISLDGRYAAFASLATDLLSSPTPAGGVYGRDLQTNVTTLLSVTPSGQPAIGFSSEPSLSNSGRYVTFASSATDIVSGDTNGFVDIFVRDRTTSTNKLVSVGPGGAQTDQLSAAPTISSDGRYVAFTSPSGRLVNRDANDTSDVFVRDTFASSTIVASVVQVSSQTGSSYSEGGGARIASATGRFVAFYSQATDLVSGDTNRNSDVFVRDRQTGTTARVSVSSTGEQGNGSSSGAAISDDGRYVAFTSTATNFVNNDTSATPKVFVHDRQTGATTLISKGLNGEPVEGFLNALSRNGRFVVFGSSSSAIAGESTDIPDVFLHDRQTGTTRRASIGYNGFDANNSSGGSGVSDDGRYVVFESHASNIVPNDTNNATDIFVRDMVNGVNHRISQTPERIHDESSFGASISADGRYVAFSSFARNLVPDDTNEVMDVFVTDRQTGITRRVSVDSAGNQAGGFPPGQLSGSQGASISPDGRYILFFSYASSLASGDTNDKSDVFVHDRITGTTIRVSNVLGNRDAFQAGIASDNRTIVFTSSASNLVASDNNDSPDVFVTQRRDIPVTRINSGGAGFTDGKGHFWEADRGFNTGTAATYTAPIANTVDDVLYQTERWDPVAQPELQYSLTVPNGSYLVRLHLAENYSRAFGPGLRLFDVDVEGVRRFEDVDIFREAGGAQTALVKSAIVNVIDGKLDLLFHHQIENPTVDAIEIIGQ